VGTGNQHRPHSRVAACLSNNSSESGLLPERRLPMIDRKKDDRSRSKPKDRPKTERPPETARRPKGEDSRIAADEGLEPASEQRDRGFDPNVNQRPPR
jgi:hypothetical protein